jgi:hypothetical protein
MSSVVSYEKSICRECGFNMGYMPCCDKVFCEKHGLTEARSSCNSFKKEA